MRTLDKKGVVKTLCGRNISILDASKEGMGKHAAFKATSLHVVDGSLVLRGRDETYISIT